VQARYRIPIARATAGNLVLVEGIDATISKTATVVSDALETEMHIFRWVQLTVLSKSERPERLTYTGLHRLT
jgi:U5 small nuclear ribonucleoprotein component